MTPFIILLVLIAILIFFTRTPDDEQELRLSIAGSPAKLTLQEIKLINRISLLGSTYPILALHLSNRFEGAAWQVSNMGLCDTLCRAGLEDKALLLLPRLDTHHRREALKLMLKALTQTGKADRAVALLEQTGEEPPHDGLIRSALLLAENKHEAACQALEDYLQSTHPDATQWLDVARLQRELGQTDAARQSLEQFWVLQHDKSADEIFDLNTFIQELVRLGDFQTLQDIATTLEISRNNPFIAPLIDAGLFEQATSLIERLEPLQQYNPYEMLFDALLQHGQLQQAETLLSARDEQDSGKLLLRLARWHIDQGRDAEAPQAIQRLSQDSAIRIDLYLALWSLHKDTRPAFADPLREQAERWVDALPDGATRDRLRLFVLDTRLLLQIRLPERQRSSYEIRCLLEETQWLNARQPLYLRTINAKQHAMRLHALGRPEDARLLLEDTQQDLQSIAEDDDMEPFDQACLQEELATCFLQLGLTEQAIALYRDIHIDRNFATYWLAALVEHDLLNQAVEHLSYNDIIGMPDAVHQLLDKLGNSAEEEHADRYQYLLDKIIHDNFWPQPVEGL